MTGKFRTLILALIAIAVLATPVARAQNARVPVVVDNNDVRQPVAPKTVAVVIGQSTVINTEVAFTRVSLASDEAVSLVVMSPQQLYLTGDQIGSTTLTVWKNEDVVAIYEVIVTPDATQLKRMIHEMLPGERNIRVMTNKEMITLSGYVSSAQALTQVLALAEAAAPKKVVNMLRVDGVHQVLLEVRVAEMSRTLLRRLGVNLQFVNNEFLVYTFLNNLTSLNNDGTATDLTSRINGVGRYTSGSNTLTGFIDALKANGVVRVLAEPSLTCLSGETADFLVGGELPIPVPGALGQVTIEWKPFGIGLVFTPTVLGSGLINLRVAPEVSEVDYTRSITLEGYEIPAISTRKTSTVIELRDGQTFAIAGLISNTLKDNSYRFPFLGDLPVLGPLFRSTDYEKSKTELVVICTAHLAKPIDPEKHRLPTDDFRDPDDYEFYMMGLMEGRKPGDTGIRESRAPKDAKPAPVVRPESGFDGDFGHSWPK